MDRGNSFAMGQSSCNGPWSPGKRIVWGYPPPAVTIYTLTGWEVPE